MTIGDEARTKIQVCRLIGQRSNTPLRRTAQRWLAGGPVLVEEAEAAVQKLACVTNADWQDRAIAALLLGHIPLSGSLRPHALGALRAALGDREMPGDAAGRKRRWRNRSAAVSSAVTAGMFIAASLNGRPATLPTLALGAVAMFVILTVWFALPLYPISRFIERRRIDVVRAAAAAGLGMQPDAESLHVLAMAAMDTSGAVREKARVAVESVLPLLSEAHYGRVSSEAVGVLCRLAQIPDSPGLTYIEAVGKVGGGAAIGPTERLARTARFADIRAAAERILPVLRARAARERDARRLLRAAEPANAPADVLLRPGGAGDSDPALLLRAGAEERDDGE